MRRVSYPLAALFSLCGFAPQLHAFEEFTKEQFESIQRGEKWLLKAQNRDGSWGMDLRTRPDISCTAISALALLAAGNTGRDGPSAQSIHAVSRALDYILKRARRTRKGKGIAEGEKSEIHQYVGQRAHTFIAVIFLSQLQGMTALNLDAETNRQIREAIVKLSETISLSQAADGSWYKDTYSSLQSTALAWMALRSTSSCGVPIKGAAVERTLKFIKGQFNPSTGFYDGGRIKSDHRPQLIYASASAIRILYGMGMDHEEHTKDGVQKILDQIATGPWGRDFLTSTGEDFPAALMLTHALIHEGGKNWETWFSFVRKRLLKIQNADGSWTATSCLRGRTFVTACSVLCLESPYRLLPLQDL